MRKKSLWNIFWMFSKIGAFTIGGGYAMIPIIEREMQKSGWISEDDLPDIVILAQSAPGLLAVNMAIYAGYNIRGLKGSIVATLGAIMPSFLIILLIASVLTGFKDNPYVIKVFQGLRPVSVSLILVPAINMAKKGCKKWWAYLLAFATMMAIAVLKVSPIYIIIVTIVVGAAAAAAMEGRKKK